MTVCDVTTLGNTATIVVNTSVADSQKVRDHYAAMYGMRANAYTFALGTAIKRVYTGSLFATFWTGLYNAWVANGRGPIFCAAGCPMGIELLDSDGSNNHHAVNFPLLVGFAPRIYADGQDPRIVWDGSTALPARGSGAGFLYSPGSQSYYRTQQDADLFDGDGLAAILETYDTGLANSQAVANIVTRYKSATPSFAGLTNVPTGLIGYATSAEDGTFPADLYDKSRIILAKSSNTQGRLATVKSRTVMLAVSDLFTGWTARRDAYLGKQLIDAGFTNVKYWYADTNSAQLDTVADSLLPVSGGINATGIGDWTEAKLDAGGTPPSNPASVTYRYGFGIGFKNDKQDDWSDQMIPDSAGGLHIGGASYGCWWAKKAHKDAGHSAIFHPSLGHTPPTSGDMYGWHQTAFEQGKQLDIQLAVVAGKTLTEAAFLGLEYTQLAVGDPLARMVQ